MLKKLLPIGFVLIFNLWIWKIFAFNVLIGLITLTTSVLLWVSIKSAFKYYSYFFVFLFVILLFFQWQTTQPSSLTYLDNDEQRVQQMRLREYSTIKLTLGEKTIWLPIAWWFEGKKEPIAFYRVQKNFFELLDLNFYFLANHPRERVGMQEFEKFPYIFIPIFLFGLFSLIKGCSQKISQNNKSIIILALCLCLPIGLISLIGHKNPIGPFALFPFFAISIGSGVEGIYKKISQLPNSFKIATLILTTFIFSLVFLQVISYAQY